MSKYFIIIILFTSSFFFLYSNSKGQCTCMGGASVGSLTPISGTSNVGVLKKDNLKATLFNSYAFGDEYFNGNTPILPGLVKSYFTNYVSISAGYGITDNFTIETELGYFFKKFQDFETYELSGSGFSHLSIFGKYNLFSRRAKEIEWTLGLGGRIPLNFDEQNLPQNIQTSTGAFGGIFMSFLHKGFKSEGLHFILVNRAEFNSENKTNYKYGSNFINSFFITKTLIQNLISIIELRNDIRLKDSKDNLIIKDSGWNVLIISPQLNFSLENFNISAFYDFPVYKYYNGNQLTNKNSLGLAVTWQSNL